MPTVRDVLAGLTGVVTREYGAFRSEMLVQGIPLPNPLVASRYYQSVLNSPESPDPLYEEAEEILADAFFDGKPVSKWALNYLATHNGYFLPPQKKKMMLEYSLQNCLVIKPLGITSEGKLFDADEDGVGFDTNDDSQWIGYRVIVWGELPESYSKDRPPVIHYLKLDQWREQLQNNTCRKSDPPEQREVKKKFACAP